MRKVRNLLLFAISFLTLSCSMSAKTDDSGKENTTVNSEKAGEVIVLNKADFLN